MAVDRVNEDVNRLNQISKKIKSKITLDDYQQVNLFTGNNVDKSPDNNEASKTVDFPVKHKGDESNCSQVNMETNQQDKKRVTFHLTEETCRQIDEMYAKSIMQGKKRDKSAMACEAFDLLYKIFKDKESLCAPNAK